MECNLMILNALSSFKECKEAILSRHVPLWRCLGFLIKDLAPNLSRFNRFSSRFNRFLSRFNRLSTS